MEGNKKCSYTHVHVCTFNLYCLHVTAEVCHLLIYDSLFFSQPDGNAKECGPKTSQQQLCSHSVLANPTNNSFKWNVVQSTQN